MMNAMEARRKTEQAIAEYEEQTQAWTKKVIAKIEKAIEDKILSSATFRSNKMHFYICCNTSVQSSLYFDIKDYNKNGEWEFDSTEGVEILSEALVMYLTESGYEAIIRPTSNTKYKIEVIW